MCSLQRTLGTGYGSIVRSVPFRAFQACNSCVILAPPPKLCEFAMLSYLYVVALALGDESCLMQHKDMVKHWPHSGQEGAPQVFDCNNLHDIGKFCKKHRGKAATGPSCSFSCSSKGHIKDFQNSGEMIIADSGAKERLSPRLWK